MSFYDAVASLLFGAFGVIFYAALYRTTKFTWKSFLHVMAAMFVANVVATLVREFLK